MTVGTKLQPADEWIQALKNGVMTRGRDFTKHPLITGIRDGRLTQAQLRLWVQQNYIPIRSVLEKGPINLDPIPEPWKTKTYENDLEERTGAFSKTTDHPSLWRKFGRSLGLTDQEMQQARSLLPTAAYMFFGEWASKCRPWFYRSITGGPLEDQVPRAWRIILPALRRHYKLSADATQFFDVHISVDEQHGDTFYDILKTFATTAEMREELGHACNHTLDLFWEHLMIPLTYDPVTVLGR